MRRVLSLLSAVALLAGCGGGSRGAHAPVTGGDEPTTSSALAHVAAEHAGEPDSARAASNLDGAFAHAPLDVELRFGSAGEYDGDAVQVAVGRGFDEHVESCAQVEDRVSGCVDLANGYWYWEEEVPEEDPGGVYVVQRKGPVTAVVAYSGPAITGDPRDQELPIGVGTLVELAADPRVDVTTTREAVEAGAAAAYWRGSP